MKLYKNYKRDGFYQILPLLITRDRKQWIFLLGFGTKNIAFIFGKNMKPKSSSLKSTAPLLPSLSSINGESSSTKRWKAKVDKINNTIRVEEEEEPVTNATKVAMTPDVKKTLILIAGVAVLGAVAYYAFKKFKK